MCVPPPTRRQWVWTAARSALPFFGFGLCDNLIMITVGDMIDSHFGVTMGFSTIVAAGLGQMISDGSGVTIQGIVENSADRLGLPDPQLSAEQKDSRRVKVFVQVCRTLGIMVGCLVGLLPALLCDRGNRPRMYDQLLKALPESERRQIAASAKRQQFSKGDVILVFGGEPTYLHNIISGEVQVIGRDDFGQPVELCRAGPGETVGLVEMVFQHSNAADVIAATPVTTLAVEHNRVHSIITPEVRKVVIKSIEDDEKYIPYRLRRVLDRS